MLKTLLLIFALFFLITPLYSQDELNNQFIEENGDGGNTILSVHNDLLLSLGWTSITTAPEPFGRSIGGVISNLDVLSTIYNN